VLGACPIFLGRNWRETLTGLSGWHRSCRSADSFGLGVQHTSMNRNICSTRLVLPRCGRPTRRVVDEAVHFRRSLPSFRKRRWTASEAAHIAWPEITVCPYSDKRHCWIYPGRPLRPSLVSTSLPPPPLSVIIGVFVHVGRSEVDAREVEFSLVPSQQRLFDSLVKRLVWQLLRVIAE